MSAYSGGSESVLLSGLVHAPVEALLPVPPPLEDGPASSVVHVAEDAERRGRAVRPDHIEPTGHVPVLEHLGAVWPHPPRSRDRNSYQSMDPHHQTLGTAPEAGPTSVQVLGAQVCVGDLLQLQRLRVVELQDVAVLVVDDVHQAPDLCLQTDHPLLTRNRGLHAEPEPSQVGA